MMKKLLLVLAAFFIVKANAQQLELVKDINTDGSAYQFNSSPSGFTEFNNKLYFSADGTKTGIELYSYDGTDVELVADVFPGLVGNDYNNSYPSNLTAFDGKLYFVATNDGDSAYIFSYDGVSTTSVAINLHLPDNELYYVKMFTYNNKLHYVTFNDVTNTISLWDYDGTNAPSLVKSESSISNGYTYKAFTEFNGDLYFFKRGPNATSSYCYKYDGTNAPTLAPSFSGMSSFSDESVIYDNKIYFVGRGPGTAGIELYSYDGVNAPVLEEDIDPGIAGSMVRFLTLFNNKIYFLAGNVNSDQELWSYDGTTATQESDINPSGSSFPSYLTVLNGKLYFTAEDGVSGKEIYEYDGVNPPVMSEEITTGTDGWGSELTAFQGKLVFNGSDETIGNELYEYDGTDIYSVANIFAGSEGSNINHITEYKGDLYFSAFETETGTELWKYDGVDATLIADLDTAHTGWLGAASSSVPQNLIVFNDLLYFRATDGNEYKYWKYDGVNPPTVDANILYNSSAMTLFNNKLYYRGDNGTNGYELWEYDGVNNSTMVANLYTGAGGSSPADLYVFDDKLIFAAYDAVNGSELWQYDGTNTPTLVSDIYSGTASSNPSEFLEYDGKLYFEAYGDTISGTELWMYDGTNAPSLELDLVSGLASNGYGFGSYPRNLNIVNDKLVFTAYDTLNQIDLWEYDFVNTPTKLTDYEAPNASNQFTKLTEIDNAIYFWADEGAGFGDELYKYDGTGSPVMFDELNIGGGNTRPSNPSNFLKYDGEIYLGANDGFVGYVWGSELYKIAGCSIDETVTQNDAQLTANESGATYQWVDCNNNNAAIAGETNQTFTATVSGDYACIVEKAGCETTTACKNVVISGIEDIDLKSKIAIYPNPTSDLLNIKTDVEVYSVNIYSVLGKKVQQETTTNFSIRTLNQGIYFVEVITAEGTMNSQIVKK